VLGQAVAENRTLRSLSLAWNGLGGRAFDDWAGVFERNSSLTHLDLAHNGAAPPPAPCANFSGAAGLTGRRVAGLCERNAVVVAENVRANRSLTVLRLSQNPLGPAGAKLIFKLVDVSPRLL